MEKQSYKAPKFEIIKIPQIDIIHTSNDIGVDNGSNDGEWLD